MSNSDRSLVALDFDAGDPAPDIVVTFSGGTMRAIWHDALAPLLEEGEFTITRASDVEPNDAGRWVADMAKSGGPMLAGPDGTGFVRRADALAAEVEWLRQNRGL